jgi:hypothetical protein
MLPPGQAAKPAGLAPRGFGTTLRLDRWVLGPAAVGLGFTAFIIYSLVSSLLLLPYFGDPPACAVGEPSIHRRYAGETRFPFILQNLHRLFLYLAFIPLTFLLIDAVASFWFEGGLRVGLGGLILSANVVLLAGFTFSCNSLRHLVGGRLDCFSCTARTRAQHGIWKRVSSINANHAWWAWASLISVVLADVYVRVLALGWIADPAIRF